MKGLLRERLCVVLIQGLVIVAMVRDLVTRVEDLSN